MIGLEIVDKYTWTAVDFIFQRPRAFFERRANDPAKYMQPVAFAVVNFLIYQAAFIAMVKVLSRIWDWEYVTGSKLPVLGEVDFATATALSGGGTLFFLLVMAGWVKLAAISVRRSISLADLLVGVAYAMSINLIAIAYLGLAVFFAFVTSGANPASVNSVGRALYWGWNLLCVALSLYLVASVAAVGRVSFGRLLTGMAIVLVAVIAVVALLSIIVAILVGH
jgi:hypothetical protein